MEKFILLIAFFKIFIVNSQSIVVDSITKKPIPYATIQLAKNSGIYSDENGRFSINQLTIDTLLISHVAYKKKKIKFSVLTDSVFLQKKENIIDEVVVYNKNCSFIVIGNKKKSNTFLFINKKTEITTLIKSNKIKSGILEKIHIPIGKKLPSKKHVDFVSLIRIHVYTVKNNLPGKELLLTNNIITVTKESSKTLELDVSNDFIEYTNQGIFIGIEMIGNKNNVNDRTIALFPSFRIAKTNKSKANKSFSKQFYQTKWKTLKEQYHSDKEQHLAIEITIKNCIKKQA